MNKSRFPTQPALVPTLLFIATLTACGGGGSDAGSTKGISSAVATEQAANAVQVIESATSALDTSVRTAQAVIAAQSAAVASEPVTCPGGGSATVTITGGTAQSVLNGQLDTGEVYRLSFTACRGAAGASSVSGSLVMTVQTASTSELSLALTANALAVELPQGGVTLTGSATSQIAMATLADGSAQWTSHYVSPSLTLSTRFNSRSNEFKLSSVDVTRQSTWLLGLSVSSSSTGQHTLEATLPSGFFNYTVSTQGSVSYSSSGVPTAGAWTINLPDSLVRATVSGTAVTITVDNGKDGTIDRTVTIPVQQLVTEAG